MRRDTHQPDKVMLTRRQRRQLLIMELDLLRSEPPSVRLRLRLRRRRLGLAPAYGRPGWRQVFASERSWKAGVLLVVVGLATALAALSTSLLAAVAGAVLAGCGLTMVIARVQQVIASRSGSARDLRC